MLTSKRLLRRTKQTQTQKYIGQTEKATGEMLPCSIPLHCHQKDVRDRPVLQAVAMDDTCHKSLTVPRCDIYIIDASHWIVYCLSVRREKGRGGHSHTCATPIGIEPPNPATIAISIATQGHDDA